MLPTLLGAVFIGLSLIHIVFLAVGDRTSASWTKLLLMPLLAAYYLVSAFAHHGNVVVPIFAGVLFGFLGDLLLLDTTHQRRFLLGLGAFLVGHLLYVLGFLLSISAASAHLIPAVFLALIPLAGHGFWYLHGLRRELADRALAVTIYVAVIIAMTFIAILRASALGSPGAWIVFIGSLFFVVSDSLLGIQLFRTPTRIRETAVMASYIVAQLLIVEGFLL